MLKIAIVGSRNYSRLDLVRNYLTENFSEGDIVISGGAFGVDSEAVVAANDLGFSSKVFYADWDKHGKAAGFIRNSLIVEAADVIIAFWDGSSRGTLDTLKKAKKAGKPYKVYGPDGERLR